MPLSAVPEAAIEHAPPEMTGTHSNGLYSQGLPEEVVRPRASSSGEINPNRLLSGSLDYSQLSGPLNDDTVAALRPVIEQACRETLRKLAQSAASPENAQSVEEIVREVAQRALIQSSETVGALVQGISATPTSGARIVSPPLLEDLQSAAWSFWRGRADDEPHAPPSTFSGVSPLMSPTSTQRQPLGVWPSPAPLNSTGPPAVPPPPIVGNLVNFAEVDSLANANCQDLGVSPDASASISLDRNAFVFPSSPESPQPHGRDRAGVGAKTVRNGLTLRHGGQSQLWMRWQSRPRAVLLVAKKGDKAIISTLLDMAAWLDSQGLITVVEPQLLRDEPQLSSQLRGRIRTFSSADALEKAIDLVVTVGGDGTLTWAVGLFGDAMPPVLSFAAGSLGFLTPYPLDGWVRTLTRFLDLRHGLAPVPLVCRMRLHVTIRRLGKGENGGELPEVRIQCLNEVLVHRGSSGQVAKLDVSVDGERVTLVQGDGLILATPTGSTAYSLAAGGSMCHPAVPAILLTPVSPHSLSFRPALLPDFAVITVGVPRTSRSSAALSIDGKAVGSLCLGDSIEVACSMHPVPTVCRTTETQDWFGAVHEALQWNQRAEQK